MQGYSSRRRACCEHVARREWGFGLRVYDHAGLVLCGCYTRVLMGVTVKDAYVSLSGCAAGDGRSNKGQCTLCF